MKILQSKVVIGILVFVAIIVLLAVTGVLKLNFTVHKLDESGPPSVGTTTKETPEAPVANQEKPLLVDKNITFGGSGKPQFSVKPPVGWVKGNVEKIDLALGSLQKEKLADGREFTPNIIFVIQPHEIPAKSINDYQTSWKAYIQNIYPSFNITKDYRRQFGVLDAYVIDGIHTQADGSAIHQVQYVVYINDKFVLAATASVPETAWSKYEEVVKASIESLLAVQATGTSTGE